MFVFSCVPCAEIDCGIVHEYLELALHAVSKKVTQ